jgi:Secretion system C-terminal sorting domain
MKKLLLSITLLGTFFGNAQILTQDFEEDIFPPTGWTTATNVATRPWTLTTNYTQATQDVFNITGLRSAIIAWIAQDQDAHLTSPAFSLVGYSDASLAFNAKLGYEYMVDPFPNGNLFVEASSDGVTWTPLWVEEDYGTYADYETLAITVDLSFYVGQPNVQVRFHYLANDADTLSLDDVVITGTLGLNEVSAANFGTSPNPAKDVVTVTNSGNNVVSSISITDINGRTVKAIETNSNSNIQINVSDLNSGIYFMNINTAEGNAVKKFIKN